MAELEARGEEVERDPFGHVKIDTINPGAWFAKQFAAKLGAEKVMVQKSGYFSRSAPADADDLRLIKSMTDLAVQVALEGGSGLIGHDEDADGVLRAIEFERVAGAKAFDIGTDWFTALMADTGQPLAPAAPAEH
jgi:pyrophosphate--fructose-6-phosphate 1-phosphotransferase